jgi:hypothetical protein
MNKHEGPGGVKYSCKLQLPCNAPLEMVEGPECNSIRGAQQVGYSMGIVEKTSNKLYASDNFVAIFII